MKDDPLPQRPRRSFRALSRYLDEMPGVPLQTCGRIYHRCTISQAAERLDYPTQKPNPFWNASSKHQSRKVTLVLDCFCGSGTTAVAAEKLGPPLDCCAILVDSPSTPLASACLSIPGVKPFAVQNLGKYERQAWQTAEFQCRMAGQMHSNSSDYERLRIASSFSIFITLRR